MTKMSMALRTSPNWPEIIRAPRSSNMNDAAAPSRSTCQHCAGSRPSDSAKARASAAAAMCTPHSSWLTSFIRCPSPGEEPTTGALRASTPSSGWARAIESSGPDTMMSRSPEAARATPPDTGASITRPPRTASRAAAAVTASGPTVAMIITIVPVASTGATPAGPNSACSSCSGVATMTATTSAPSTAAAMARTGRTPAPASSWARSGATS